MEKQTTAQPNRVARLYKVLSFYPPFIAAGIRVRYRDPDFDVHMSLTWYNRNAVGTHFGGSLYAMCDPFFVLILLKALGQDYIVWDKAATIEFLRPGDGKVSAHFHIPDEMIADIRQRADAGEKVEPLLCVDVTNRDGMAVAHVEKRLYVRKRQNG